MLDGKKIALIVDQPQRDLAGLVLVAHGLCQLGATCHLVSLNIQDRELWALRPDFVLLNYARVSNHDVARGLLEAGIPFGLLDTEGGVWESFNSYVELLWTDRRLFESLRVACMWGTKMADHLCEKGILRRDQVRLTGCPRFDFYHDHWKAVLLEEDEDGGQGDDRPAILVNTNFSVGNPRFTSRQESIAYQSSEYGWSPAYVKQIVDREDEAIRITIEIARDIARDYPQARVILRPHPHEDPKLYHDAFRDCPQVTINTVGPVAPRILRAKAVVQRSCTTAIEAGMAGVPTLSPQWMPVPFLMKNAEDASIPCTSYGELRRHLDAILNGAHHLPGQLEASIQEIIRDWFLDRDGRAHQRVIESISGVVPREVTPDMAVVRRRLYGLDKQAQSWAVALGRHVRHFFRLSPDWSFGRFQRSPANVWEGTSKELKLKTILKLLASIHRAAALCQGAGRKLQPVDAVPSSEIQETVDGTRSFSVALRARGSD